MLIFLQYVKAASAERNGRCTETSTGLEEKCNLIEMTLTWWCVYTDPNVHTCMCVYT